LPALRQRAATIRLHEEKHMKAGFVGLALLTVLGLPALAQNGTADRLYVMDCGNNAAADQSRWSPGVNVGKPIELSDNCYLIRHGSDWLLWDTGYPDAIAEKPVSGPVGTATRARTLAAQLAEVGVKPADIKYVAVSHHHGDHIGNVDMFPDSTLLMQKAEFDFAFAPDKKPPFKAERQMVKRQAQGSSSIGASRHPRPAGSTTHCLVICAAATSGSSSWRTGLFRR
jgi:N-acyl homoserine lactone hydrolase